MSKIIREETHPKCEACGLQGPATHIRVRTTNGGLLLCVQCLGDINRKNPLVQKLRDLIARLESEAESLHNESRLVCMFPVQQADMRGQMKANRTIAYALKTLLETP